MDGTCHERLRTKVGIGLGKVVVTFGRCPSGGLVLRSFCDDDTEVAEHQKTDRSGILTNLSRPFRPGRAPLINQSVALSGCFLLRVRHDV